MNPQNCPFTRMGLIATAMATASISISHATPLTWDPAGGGASDGSGTWLDTGKWWDGAANVDWNNATPDDATIGNGGSGGTITLGAVTAGTVSISNFTGNYTLNGTSLDQSGGITVDADAGELVTINPLIGGVGGITKTGDGILRLNKGGNTPGTNANDYSGPTVVNGGVLQLGTGWTNAQSLGGGISSNTTGLSNLEINGGNVRLAYYLRRGLGAGPSDFQITGGTSGFSHIQSDTHGRISVDNSTSFEVVWGAANEAGNALSTGYFNPSAFEMNNAAASPNQVVNLQNPLDLNGSDRTVVTNATANCDNGQVKINNGWMWTTGGRLTGVIRNTAGSPAGLIKTGPGHLQLTAANTYDGGTTVSEGMLGFTIPAAMPATGNVAFATGTGLQVVLGGSGFTGAAAGAGSLGGLLAGTGGSGGTVSYAGSLSDLEVRLDGAQTYAGVIPAFVEDVFSFGGALTLTGNSLHTGTTTVGTTLQQLNDKLILGVDNALPPGGALTLAGRDPRVAMDLKGFDQEVGPLFVKGGQSWALTEIVDTVGGGVLTLSGGATAFDQNNNQVLISVDTVDLDGAEQTIKVDKNETSISSTIQNGSLTKTGSKELILSGTNTYTGETKVSAGILQTTSTTCLADASEVRMDGGVMNLNFAGTDVIAELYIGGAPQGTGVYDATSNPGQFTGTGSLTVGAVATPPFESWAGGTGPGLGFDEDKNGDGVDNGMAFLLGAANPDADANSLLPTPSDDGLGGLKMTFTMLDSASRGAATLGVQHSSDLGATDAWAPVAPGSLVPDTTGTVSGVDYVVSGSGTLSVEATIPSGNASGGKLFGRLLATE